MTKRQVMAMLFACSAVMFVVAAGTGAIPDGAPDEGAESLGTEGREVVPVLTRFAKPVAEYVQRRSYTGVLRAARRSELSFERPGKVVKMLVDEGQRVSKGELLADLDTRHLTAKRLELTALRKQAAAVLAELLEGPRAETIASARADVMDAESQMRSIQQNHRRRDRLLTQGAITQESYDDSSFTLASAEARAESVRQRLAELEAGTRAEQVEAQRGAVERLDAQLLDLEHDLDDAKLTAPFAGTIVSRMADEGRVVAAGSPVLELLEDEHLEAWIGLPGDVAAELTPQAAYSLSVDQETVSAVAVSALPEVDAATRTRMTIFRVDNPPSHFVAGAIVRLEIPLRRRSSGFLLPTSALVRGVRGLWSVYVVGGVEETGVIRRESIEVLDTLEHDSVVRGTLRPGDRVVISGVHRVVAGQSVRALDESSGSGEGDSR